MRRKGSEAQFTTVVKIDGFHPHRVRAGPRVTGVVESLAVECIFKVAAL